MARRPRSWDCDQPPSLCGPRIDEGHLERILLGPGRAAARERERRHGERQHEPAEYELSPHLLLLSGLPTDRATIRQAASAITLPAMEGLQRRLAVARGDEPADLVVRGGRVLSVFTREWLDADVAVVDGVDRRGRERTRARETLDASGQLRRPGLHRRAHAPRVGEAHGRRVRAARAPARGRRQSSPIPTRSRTSSASTACTGCSTRRADLQLDVYFMAPSCVPASPFESPRRPLTPGDLESLMRRRRVLGLAEMMNFPGVVAGSPDELAKLALDGAQPRRRARARPARARAAGLRGCRHLLRPRGADGRGGARAAPCRDVAARSARRRWRATCARCCRSSRSTGRGASRSARTIAIPRTSRTPDT